MTIGASKMSRTGNLVIEHAGQPLPIAVKLRLTGDHLLLFMHGLGCAKECFDGAFAAAALDDFSICTFDFPGHGDSGQPDASCYSLQAYAEVVNAIIDRLGLSRVSLIAHSMGGAVGLIATQGRADVDCFIDVDGNLVSEDCSASRATAEQPLDSFIKHGSSEFLAGLRRSGRPDLGAWAAWCARAQPAAVHGIAGSLVEWSDNGKLLDLFTSLRNKVYVYGTNERKQYLTPRLRKVPVRQIAGAGHFPMLDDPASFYSLLAEFVPAAGPAAANLTARRRDAVYSLIAQPRPAAEPAGQQASGLAGGR
jgi:pimeloyl-ACP methyl ester carboxylesterase